MNLSLNGPFFRVLREWFFPGFSRPVSRGNRERKIPKRLREREHGNGNTCKKLCSRNLGDLERSNETFCAYLRIYSMISLVYSLITWMSSKKGCTNAWKTFGFNLFNVVRFIKWNANVANPSKHVDDLPKWTRKGVRGVKRVVEPSENVTSTTRFWDSMGYSWDFDKIKAPDSQNRCFQAVT